MKKLLLLLLVCTSISLSAQSQHTEVASPVESAPVAKWYGCIHYDSLLHAMPEYLEAMSRWKTLQKQYEEEVAYNERGFKQQFADFLEGQKKFSTTIMLKRQSDLQNAMERGLQFRHRADSLLQAAQKELLAPVRLKLDQAIFMVGKERHYHLIINLDHNAAPYINNELAEDATPYIKERLMKGIIQKP